jgi:hypothetical protein
MPLKCQGRRSSDLPINPESGRSPAAPAGRISSASQATVISMTGQANSIGQATVGPAFGWVGNAVSIQAALLASAIVISPTLTLYHRLMIRHRGAAEPSPNITELIRNE